MRSSDNLPAHHSKDLRTIALTFSQHLINCPKLKGLKGFVQDLDIKKKKVEIARVLPSSTTMESAVQTHKIDGSNNLSLVYKFQECVQVHHTVKG